MRALLSAVLPAATKRTIESINTALWAAPVVAFTEKYLFSDWPFLGFLATLVMVDTVFGVQRNWVKHTISSRAFSRLFLKVGIYLGLLVLTHVMTSFTIHGEVNMLFQWFDSFIYTCMMAREALSILEHMAIIEPSLVPKALLKRLALVADEGPTALAKETEPEPVTGCAGPIESSPTTEEAI